MNDDDFVKLLEQYLEPPAEPNPAMAGVVIVWVRDQDDYGAKHIWEKHELTEREVEEVLLEIPPYVEARRDRDHPNRTLFWGATRGDRWLFVVCEDWTESGERHLKPLTAFEPDEGEAYWRSR